MSDVVSYNMNDRSFNKEIAMTSNEQAERVTKRDEAATKRRRKILDAAMMCFLERGYHQTGVRDIAKRAGISLGNLYNHFPGKHDVLAEIAALERCELQPFLKLLAGTAPAPEILDTFIARYGTYLAAPENIILTIEISSEAIRKPDIGEMFLANRNVLVNALASVIRRGVTEGQFRADLQPDDTSQMIIELIEGSAYRGVLGGVAMQKGALRDFVFAAMRD